MLVHNNGRRPFKIPSGIPALLYGFRTNSLRPLFFILLKKVDPPVQLRILNVFYCYFPHQESADKIHVAFTLPENRGIAAVDAACDHGIVLNQ
jgi:hypothetical protein